jgi:hypothetical protein
MLSNHYQYTNMRKLIISAMLITSAITSQANTATVSVAPAAFSLLCTGPAKVSQLIVVGTTSTNASGLLVDTATNTTVYVLNAYTNTISYLTNQPSIYTNYFGVLSTNADSNGTNWVLVDVANAVDASTNSLPTVGVSVTGNNTIVINSMNTTFYRGIWVTNTGSGTMSVTATYLPQ